MNFPRKEFVAVCVILFGFFTAISSAQELPPITIFTPQDYQAETQNWSISQDENNNIYIANNKGLLEFNGANWTLYPSVNESIMRSVLAVDNKIYSGCYMEFGYWERNSKGELIYNSLSKEIKENLVEDEQFWNIIAVEDAILFQSLDRIYIYNLKTKEFNIIDSSTSLTKLFKQNGDILFHKLNQGLYKLENGNEVLVSDAQVIKDNVLVNAFLIDKKVILETQNNGFYELSDTGLEIWDAEINTVLNGISGYNSLRLNNGNLAIGTISDGIYMFSPNGSLIQHISQENGLSNNTVLSIFEDKDNNLWLGLDNGINCLNMNSPFKIYYDKEGKIGSVYAVELHKNVLYLGSNQGLFYKNYPSDDPFTFVEGTQGQVWFLDVIQNQLFCGHNYGTFLIEDKKAIKISDIQGTWHIKSIPNNPNLLMQGNYNGLHILSKSATWNYRNKVEGFDISSRFFEFTDSQTVIVNHEYKGVYKVEIDEALNKVVRSKKNKIEKGLNSGLTKYNNDVYYAYKKGIYKYDVEGNNFIKDTVLNKSLFNDNYVSGKLVKTADDLLWNFTESNINYFIPSNISDVPTLYSIPLSNELRRSILSYEDIVKTGDTEYLIGSTSGYITINLNKQINKPYTITINRVTSNTIEGQNVLLDRNLDEKIPFNSNNIEFSFNSTHYNKYFEPVYQTKLEGLYDQWSSWSTISTRNFDNLPHGDYAFKVRSKIGNEISENEAAYEFSIAKPWHLSNTMITIYALIFIVVSLFIHSLYKSYYSRQRVRILMQTQKEIELKDLENKQQRMQFKTERLEQDIESKNRELAISTLSLIKKNEFLNTLKNELKKGPEQPNVNAITRIIDNNLNNTDDWKLFKEAFNNADKDFLNKVKDKHPMLTPNDLKLCAYLRLNLSSKEIAPLLNISPRSVEVKRYRLRKKMNLPHEESLTNYILEI